jgi:hypothetical protein
MSFCSLFVACLVENRWLEWTLGVRHVVCVLSAADPPALRPQCYPEPLDWSREHAPGKLVERSAAEAPAASLEVFDDTAMAVALTNLPVPVVREEDWLGV